MQRARLLSPRQYDNTIEDLLGIGGNPAREFGGGADTQLDDLGAERRANAAASIARQAAAQLTTWAPCAATAADCGPGSSTLSAGAPSGTRCRTWSASS